MFAVIFAACSTAPTQASELPEPAPTSEQEFQDLAQDQAIKHVHHLQQLAMFCEQEPRCPRQMAGALKYLRNEAMCLVQLKQGTLCVQEKRPGPSDDAS